MFELIFFRWFEDPEKGELSSTRVRNILPVDLNSFLAKSAKIIADVHKLAGNRDQVFIFIYWLIWVLVGLFDQRDHLWLGEILKK